MSQYVTGKSFITFLFWIQPQTHALYPNYKIEDETCVIMLKETCLINKIDHIAFFKRRTEIHIRSLLK